MFALEIEYLNGISFSAARSDKNEVEWPPNPDRVFLALVAAWGESTKDPEEADALRWLESQNPPDVLVPHAHRRTDFKNFVPTSSNDAQSLTYFGHKEIKGRGKVYEPIYEIEKNIIRKQRFFPAMVLPDDSRVVYMIWNASDVPAKYRTALLNLTSSVSRLGHSASLVRVTVSPGTNHHKCENRWVRNDDEGYLFLRCPYKGRFDSLTEEYQHYSSLEDTPFRWRPSRAPAHRYLKHVSEEIPNRMGGDWTVLACKAGDVPPLRAFPVVAKRMRDAIMSHIHDPVHAVISGHNPDGTSLQKPHLAIIPLANVGWKKYSDGRLLGLAMILPSTSKYGSVERRQLKGAVIQFLNSSQSKPEEAGTLQIGMHTKLQLKRYNGDKASLQSGRYMQSSKTWNTVTPIVLDKHPKKNKSAEDIISDSCENVELPRPVSIEISRYSRVVGASAAFTAKKSSDGWMPPKRGMLDNKFICHASLRFNDMVRGPVIIGSGRYYGLGLCVRQGERV